MRFIFSILVIIGGLILAVGAYAESPIQADSKKPIDITADSLEVLQDQQLAIFTGNVVAVQGTIKLTSKIMKVYYKEKTQAATSKSKDEQGISKIEVEGDVYLTTQQETARGQKGVYDVDKERLTLRGDVVLTRGESIVKGEALEYDLALGRSRIIGAGVTAGSAQNDQASGKSGRVRGRFVPDKKPQSEKSVMKELTENKSKTDAE